MRFLSGYPDRRAGERPSLRRIRGEPFLDAPDEPCLLVEPEDVRLAPELAAGHDVLDEPVRPCAPGEVLEDMEDARRDGRAPVFEEEETGSRVGKDISGSPERTIVGLLVEIVHLCVQGEDCGEVSMDGLAYERRIDRHTPQSPSSTNPLLVLSAEPRQAASPSPSGYTGRLREDRSRRSIPHNGGRKAPRQVRTLPSARQNRDVPS